MALKPSTLYPTKTNAASSGYPYGSARNVTVSGDGTGTPWTAEILNDIWGFLQALLAESTLVATGTPDQVGASQYLDAILQKGIIGNNAIGGVGLNKLQAGTALITTGVWQISISSSMIRMTNNTNPLATDILEIKAGTGSSEAAVKYTSGTSGRVIQIDAFGMSVEDAAGSSFQLKTVINGEGVSHSGGPGSNVTVSRRTDGFSAASLSWSLDSGTNYIYYTPTDLVLTGIPWGATIYDVRLEFIDGASNRINAPVNGLFKDNGSGVTQLDNASMLGGTSPTGATAPILWVTYNGAAVD